MLCVDNVSYHIFPRETVVIPKERSKVLSRGPDPFNRSHMESLPIDHGKKAIALKSQFFQLNVHQVFFKLHLSFALLILF